MNYVEDDGDADWALIGAIIGHLDTEINLLLERYAEILPDRLRGDLEDKLSEFHIWFKLGQKFNPERGVPDFPHENDYRAHVCKMVPGRLSIATMLKKAVDELLDENIGRNVAKYGELLERVR